MTMTMTTTTTTATNSSTIANAITGSWNQSVGIVTNIIAGSMRISGFIPSRGTRFYSTPKHPDQFLSPPSLLINEYYIA